MAFDADEDILQDFLVEASEILEQLSEQLVQLERTPDDLPLLNAIFRGFHTVKGGAGFLNLTALVEVCHLGENIFDKLRNFELRADVHVMDLVLQVLDVVNTMFDEVRAGNVPAEASREFLARLQDCADGKMSGGAPAAKTPAPAPPPTKSAATPAPQAPKPTLAKNASANASSDEISDDEFEALLNELHGSGGPGKTAAPPPTDKVPEKPSPAAPGEITDDEFESLLDELHGKGNKPAQSSPAASSDSITDDEFENLLDSLHGKGNRPVVVGGAASSSDNTASDKISDNEFESLLDQLHGKGQMVSSTVASASHSNKKEPSVAPPKREEIQAAPANAAAMAATANSPVAQADTTVRVDTKRLDDIMNLVGELVLARNRLVTISGALPHEDLAKAVATLDLVTSDLQGSVMQTRMQPIKKVFGRFPRVVRDLARSLKKEIDLELIGEETDLDKNMVEALADPLVHLVRNSVDHGIEMPDERVAAGKPRVGKIILSAAQEGDHIQLSIRDDGKGMNPEFLKKKAVEKGILDADHAERLSDTEAYNLIFMPGFSTKAEVSDISGRGVGMDVVKTRIAQLNGSIMVTSELGQGSVIQIKLPLTLAILPTLMVRLSRQVFALPLASVAEIFHLDLTKTNVVDGQLTVIVRQKALPLFYLEEWLVRGAARGIRRKEGFVVIVQVGSQRVGFVVDALIGQQEVVIKPLGKSLQGTPGMAGATITSDGGIALIMDIPALLKHYGRRIGN